MNSPVGTSVNVCNGLYSFKCTISSIPNNKQPNRQIDANGPSQTVGQKEIKACKTAKWHFQTGLVKPEPNEALESCRLNIWFGSQAFLCNAIHPFTHMHTLVAVTTFHDAAHQEHSSIHTHILIPVVLICIHNL